MHADSFDKNTDGQSKLLEVQTLYSGTRLQKTTKSNILHGRGLTGRVERTSDTIRFKDAEESVSEIYYYNSKLQNGDRTLREGKRKKLDERE